MKRKSWALAAINGGVLLATGFVASIAPPAGASGIDGYADSVVSLTRPASTDVSGDNEDGGADATGAPNCPAVGFSVVGNNDCYTSLGFDAATGEGGRLVLALDEICVDGPGWDVRVWEVGPAVEAYRVDVGQNGTTTTVGTDDGSIGEFDIAGSGLTHFNRVAITALGDDSGNTHGADIDAVECAYTARHLLTGGGQVSVGRRPQWSFGGNVADTIAGPIGRFQITDHASRVACHFDTITNLVFSGGEATSPDATADTVEFDAAGRCNDGSPAAVHVVVHDAAEGGRGADTISVTGRFVFSGPLTGGNFQVHDVDA